MYKNKFVYFLGMFSTAFQKEFHKLYQRLTAYCQKKNRDIDVPELQNFVPKDENKFHYRNRTNKHDKRKVQTNRTNMHIINGYQVKFAQV